ncbi:MAG: T9SS C-terminal target domain-containing protein, partial [Chitinophagia bacterium]|nr:T9SS C-terminal target domain-containing protein [Chitinophagia bacterium]
TTNGFEASIAPNPATGNAVVTFNAGVASNTVVSIFNAAGERVLVHEAGNTQSGKINLSLGQLPTGSYFVQVASGSNQKTMKLVIQ